MGASRSSPLVRPYAWPTPSRCAGWWFRSSRERMFMYWLNPSSMKPYHVSFVPTIIGHHSWPVSWSAGALAADMMNIGYSIPLLRPVRTG